MNRLRGVAGIPVTGRAVAGAPVNVGLVVGVDGMGTAGAGNGSDACAAGAIANPTKKIRKVR
jgi:hypothetical protein